MNLEARRKPATIFCMSPPTHNRYPYSPIPARAIYDWPDGKRLATAGGYRGRWEIKIWDTTQWQEKRDGK